MMTPRKAIPASIAQRLRYEPSTGDLVDRRSGRVVGNCAKDGYLRVGYGRASYAAHRVVWLLVSGSQPPSIIDHRDGDRRNNRWENLRAADASMNVANSRCRGPYPKGVCLHKATGRYQAAIKVRGRNHYLGLFATPDLAHAAYVAEAERVFGEFARAA